MKYVPTAILLVVGLINFYPIVGVISAERLMKLYGVGLENSDLVILMRHRAVLFGLLGAFIIAAAFKSSLQLLACVAGLVSMIAFIALAYAAGDYGDALRKVIVADIAASIGLVVVLALRVWGAVSSELSPNTWRT